MRLRYRSKITLAREISTKYLLAPQWMVPPRHNKSSGYLSWQMSNDNSFSYGNKVSTRCISGIPLALQHLSAGCHISLYRWWPLLATAAPTHMPQCMITLAVLLLHSSPKIFHYFKFLVILIFKWSACIRNFFTQKFFTQTFLTRKVSVQIKYLRSSPLHWNLSTMRNVVILIFKVPAHPKVTYLEPQNKHSYSYL